MQKLIVAIFTALIAIVVFSNNKASALEGYLDTGNLSLYNTDKRLYDNNAASRVKASDSTLYLMYEQTIKSISVQSFITTTQSSYPKSYYIAAKFYQGNTHVSTVHIDVNSPTGSLQTYSKSIYPAVKASKIVMSYEVRNEDTYVTKACTVYCYVAEIDFDIEINKIPVKNVKVDEITYNSAHVTWDIFHLNSKEYTKIMIDNVTPDSGKNYRFKNLQPDTVYEGDIKVFYGSSYVTTPYKFKTLPAPKNDERVSNLTATSTHKSVKLSWDKSGDNIAKYNIYDNKNKLVRSVTATTTNTTYEFNNLKSNTQYSYTVKTVSKDDIEEQKGRSIDIRTKDEPPISLDKPSKDGEDYIFTWSQPTDGRLQVFVGGKKYKIVNASDKKIVIPAADMQFTSLDDPDVTFQKIDDNGDLVGDVVRPPSIEFAELPSDLTGTNLLKVSTALLLLVGGFLLLSMSFLVVPRLINLIRGGSGGGAEQVARDINKRRRTGG